MVSGVCAEGNNGSRRCFTLNHHPPRNATQYHTIPHNIHVFHSTPAPSSQFVLHSQGPNVPLGKPKTANYFSSAHCRRRRLTIYQHVFYMQYHTIPHNTKPNYFSSSNCHLTIYQHVFHPGPEVANGQRRPRKLFFTVSKLGLGKRVAVAVAEPGQERIADPPTTRRHRSLS